MARRGLLTIEERKRREQTAVDIIREGGTVDDANQCSGIAHTVIRHLCKRAGVTPPVTARGNITPSQALSAVAMLKDGTRTVRDIAELLGVNHQRVSGIRTLARNLGLLQPTL